jgi:hypothetical protein
MARLSYAFVDAYDYRVVYRPYLQYIDRFLAACRLENLTLNFLAPTAPLSYEPEATPQELRTHTSQR